MTYTIPASAPASSPATQHGEAFMSDLYDDTDLERAAKALYESAQHPDLRARLWDTLDRSTQCRFRAQAGAVLAAAAPRIAETAWGVGCDAGIRQADWEYGHVRGEYIARNPYTAQAASPTTG